MTDRPADTTLGELRAAGYRDAERQGGAAREPARADPVERAVPARHPRLRGDRPAAARERDPGRAGRHPARRARPGKEPDRPIAGRAAGSVGAVHRRHRAARRSAATRLAAGPQHRGRAGRRHADRLVGVRGSLQREAGDARHQHRRPDRRGRPGQGGRRTLPVRRADDPLRPAAADASGHLQPQRAAGPGRADPGRPAQRDGGARRPGARLPRAPRARPVRDRQRQPGGLHQPRPDHHAAQGPIRRADPNALPRGDGDRDRDHGGGGRRVRRGGRRRIGAGPGAGLHEGGRRRAVAAGTSLIGGLPALRRVACG